VWFVGGCVLGWEKIGAFGRYFLGGRERQKQQLLQKTEADPYGMTSKKGNGNRKAKATAKTNAGVLPLRLALFAQGQNDSVGVGGLG
jgi:hypothetical protein